jgi:hypothetical protein
LCFLRVLISWVLQNIFKISTHAALQFGVDLPPFHMTTEWLKDCHAPYWGKNNTRNWEAFCLNTNEQMRLVMLQIIGFAKLVILIVQLWRGFLNTAPIAQTFRFLTCKNFLIRNYQPWWKNREYTFLESIFIPELSILI